MEKSLEEQMDVLAKKNDSGKLIKQKARLMARGFVQKKGIDFDEIFSLFVKTICFFYGDLDEEIYITHPERFEVEEK